MEAACKVTGASLGIFNVQLEKVWTPSWPFSVNCLCNFLLVCLFIYLFFSSGTIIIDLAKNMSLFSQSCSLEFWGHLFMHTAIIVPLYFISFPQMKYLPA